MSPGASSGGISAVPYRALIVLSIAVVLSSFCAGAGRAEDVAGSRRSQKQVLPWEGTPSASAAYERAAAIGRLGRAMFFDRSLSASGQMSCATCHDPAHGFAAPNALSVQPGGTDLTQFGTRSVPGLTYGAFTPFFTEHFYDEEDGNGGLDQGPTGGRTWDGRVSRAREQAAIPLIASNEMANAGAAAVVARVASAGYATALRTLYGRDIFGDPARAFAAIGEALEFYQQTPAEFSPFSSKYDAFLRGQVSLTAEESRGLATFNNPAKGNCAVCHKSQPSSNGSLPLFTDFGFVALGVPRNAAIAANADPAYHDLGLCGPQRTDLADRAEFCGLFKAPSLRNVALRGSFYHNGVLHSLSDAVAFYASRDTNPERWYPVGADGVVRKYDDLPAAYRQNINTDPPFGQRPGEAPALSPSDVADIVAFLQTLTDGYRVDGGNPSAASRR